MKGNTYLIIAALAILLSSCGGGKSNEPAPNNNTGATDSTGNTGSTGGTSTTLAITDFSPKTGKPFSNITITGTGFGTDPSAVQVAIGSSPYNHPISVTATTMIIQTNLATPSGKISVIISGKTVTSSGDFTALPPDLSVVGIFPTNGPIYQLGHNMGISGNGFGTDMNKINVSFGGTAPVHANYIAPDGLAITAMIPRYAQEDKVTVTVSGISVTCSQTYTFGMSLRDYTPKTFHVGDIVTITGVGFTTTSDMNIDFNNNKVTRPTSVTPTTMQVIVPAGAKSGYLNVSAAFGTITDFTPDKFTVLP